MAARNGIQPQPPKQWLQTALLASGEAEGVVKEQLRKRGWTVEDGEFVQHQCEDGGVLTGNTDGFISGANLDRCVLEIKALGKDLFQKYVRGGISNMGEPFARMYGMQISSYMLATGLPCLVAVYGKDSETTLEKLYEEPPFDEGELCARMAQVHRFAEKKEWPDCDAGCTQSSWYWHIHPEKEHNRLDDEEVEAMLAKYSVMKETIDRLTDEKNKLGDELKEILAHGQNEVGSMTATLVQFPQTRVDIDAIRREMGDEFVSQFEYQQMQTQLRGVKKRKGF